jgi:hypothetical protein
LLSPPSVKDSNGGLGVVAGRSTEGKLSKLASLIGTGAYRMSYVVALPLLPLSPLGSQTRSTEIPVGSDAANPETGEGGTPGVVNCRMFDRPEVLGTSSLDLTAM